MAGHLTKEERDRIAQLSHQGHTQTEIARALNRSQGSISRELARNSTNGHYYAAQAHDQAEDRRRGRPLVRKMDRPEISEFVRAGLAQYWSPEQIEGRMKLEFPNNPERCVSAQAIYDWISEQGEYRGHWVQFLRRRGKRPYRARKTSDETSSRAQIGDRPNVIEERERLGDFEGDTVLGSPGKGGIATLVDRQSRFTIMTRIKSKQAHHVRDKLHSRLKGVDDDKRQSMTFDNGSEFAEADRLATNLDMDVYYAEPGCPFQRGTNENTNGLIRQFFPKGTDFRDVSHHEVRRAENLLNNRPRACLNFQTPNEVFHGKPA